MCAILILLMRKMPLSITPLAYVLACSEYNYNNFWLNHLLVALQNVTFWGFGKKYVWFGYDNHISVAYYIMYV